VSESVVANSQGDGTRVLIERMAEAATAWLASLSPDQRQKATFDFPANDERTLWYYTPTERGGLPLAEMDAIQQRLARRLVASGLSTGGYVTVATIMGLENVLDAIEDWQTSYPGRAAPSRGRDPLLYFVSAFGTPGEKSWGWRIGGHHISLQYAVVDSRLASPTPLFFGANPAESHLVGPGTLRPLAGEEDLGRDLLHALDPEQAATAILAPIAPYDIVQSNRPFVEEGAMPRPVSQLFGRTVSEEQVRASQGVFGRRRTPESAPTDDLQAVRYEREPKGLPGRRMTGGQKEIFAALVRQYVNRLPDEIADLHASRASGPALEALHFAWAGGREHGEKHYYRIQGPRLLIEYDNTQDNANHIHAVWRDPEGDFGADLLAEHYRQAH
jgi:hypothetical protein